MIATFAGIAENEVIAVLRDAAACHSIPGGLIVNTQCLYPSNSVVSVAVLGDEPYTVSDRGGALDVLSSHGVEVRSPVRTLLKYTDTYGLDISNAGEIFLRNVDLAFLPAAINFVANASKDAAMFILDKHRLSPLTEFRDELKLTLRKAFVDRVSDQFRVVGASNKPHIFDHALFVSHSKKILISAAYEDGNSINAVVVANLDVRLRRDVNFIQKIIYDNRLNWRSESLSLLEEGAPVIGYTEMVPQLEPLVVHPT